MAGPAFRFAAVLIVQALSAAEIPVVTPAEASIETLVFVPGGSLRAIPMASLHDGERFLIVGLLGRQFVATRKREVPLLGLGIPESGIVPRVTAHQM